MRKFSYSISGCIKTKQKLPKVTLMAAASVRVPETMKALEVSMRGLEFAEVILFTDQRPEKVPQNIRIVTVPKMKSVDDYSRFLLFEAYHYIKTEYALVVQWDGYVVHPEKWNPEFLQYDYIGALWPESLGFQDAMGRLCRVGNGGASLRSRRLMAYPEKHRLEWKPGDNEDVFLCCQKRVELEKDGMRFAPPLTAAGFSQERTVPENNGIVPFAFHQWEGHNAQYLRFDRGPLFHGKQRLIGLLIRLGWYDRLRSCCRRQSEKR